MSVTTSPVSLKVEQSFYAIARWFVLVLAALLFIGAVIMGVQGARQLSSHVDENIIPPKISYESISRSHVASKTSTLKPSTDTTLEESEQALAVAQELADFERKLKPQLENIIKSLKTYADVMEVGAPSEKAVGNYIRSRMEKITSATDEAMAWHYVAGLEQATKQLADNAGTLVKLEADDARRIRWDEFLDIYTRDYVEELSNEFQRIDNQHSQVRKDKMEAERTLAVAAGVFLTFIATTALLVLFGIERNTRQR